MPHAQNFPQIRINFIVNIKRIVFETNKGIANFCIVKIIYLNSPNKCR